MHPLSPDFSTIKDVDLQSKITELAKLMMYASRQSSTALAQMQMLYQDYLEENQRRETIKLQDMLKANTQNFDDIIDIG
jgi:hypothetical protein